MKERDFGIDLVKLFACLFVVAVHFDLYSGFYSAPIIGTSMFLQCCARWFFYICVPLFMITTGYLQHKKGLDKKHYLSLLPVLASYVFIATICFFFRKYYLKEKIDYFDGLLSVLNFTADPYGWYVEMFVGLFLMIPFLNMIYNALKTKRQKLLLIGISLFLTSGTTLLSSFSISGRQLNVSTDWWAGVYPIAFYFIGAYIHEYQVKLSRSLSIAAVLSIIAVVVFESALSKNKDSVFDSKFTGYNCVYTVIVAVLFFLLIYRANTSRLFVRAAVASISKQTLDIYLFSYIFDKIYYPELVKQFFHGTAQFGYIIFISVPLVFISALAAAILKNLLFAAVKSAFGKRRISSGREMAAG